jgi:hypothetical protein
MSWHSTNSQVPPRFWTVLCRERQFLALFYTGLVNFSPAEHQDRQGALSGYLPVPKGLFTRWVPVLRIRIWSVPDLFGRIRTFWSYPYPFGRIRTFLVGSGSFWSDPGLFGRIRTFLVGSGTFWSDPDI